MSDPAIQCSMKESEPLQPEQKEQPKHVDITEDSFSWLRGKPPEPKRGRHKHKKRSGWISDIGK